IADSHMNALVRFKLALTENNPTVKPYDENLWAETVDNQLPVKNSIRLLKAIHAKWTILLENMDKNDFKRTYFHPEMNRTVSLEEMLATYAWHGKHHVAQIAVALKNG
ncbi:MAG TPA: DinB family protein, partial [Chitinophagales bacterium]|nr:DinB family protein [Chitinophagales bacterium]